MRVISGTAKGRKLTSPGEATRPITDRVKENLFNILGPDVINANVLDLYAGAGSVGIEALSRGARHATFVEKDSEALEVIRENLRRTKLIGRATIAREDVFKYIKRPHPEVYDLIYVAPPQYRDLWSKTLRALAEQELLAVDGEIVVQLHPKEYHE